MQIAVDREELKDLIRARIEWCNDMTHQDMVGDTDDMLVEALRVGMKRVSELVDALALALETREAA